MNLIDIVEKQNEIIRRQSELIVELCMELAQHATLDAIEAELAEINKLKQELS